jgi:hypothetical protein
VEYEGASIPDPDVIDVGYEPVVGIDLNIVFFKPSLV